MRFFNVERPANPRRCWAAEWCWFPKLKVESKHTQCGNYARVGHLTCLQHRWREGAAWNEAERLAREEKR